MTWQKRQGRRRDFGTAGWIRKASPERCESVWWWKKSNIVLCCVDDDDDMGF
jgi:hypothetical protein